MLGDLGVSFHCNVASNLRASRASLSAKKGKDNCEEKKLVFIMMEMGSMIMVLIVWVYNYYRVIISQNFCHVVLKLFSLVTIQLWLKA